MLGRGRGPGGIAGQEAGASGVTTEPSSATEPGIEADTVEVHHIRQELENLIDIGFGVDVGDPTHMFDTLVDVINDECGGIRGRTVRIGHASFDPLSPDIDQARIAACLVATEDHHAAFVMSSTGLQGTATLCVARSTTPPSSPPSASTRSSWSAAAAT